jgi:hypothetical protein
MRFLSGNRCILTSAVKSICRFPSSTSHGSPTVIPAA